MAKMRRPDFRRSPSWGHLTLPMTPDSFQLAKDKSAIGDFENENDGPDADDPQPENREATKPTNRSLNLSAPRARRLL